jgi:predicted nucleic acid-binding protein
MAKKYSLQDIPAIQNRKVFFDANVLIYVFWPSGSYYWEKFYSTAFGRLLRQQNELLVDFIVISEIINRSHRLEYGKHLASNNISKSNLSYKQYRNSPDGQTALSDIYLIIKTNILNNFTVVGKSFTKTDIQSFLTVEQLDFSDKGILLTCKENACVLLTNDTDYKTADIDILSSNPDILNCA